MKTFDGEKIILISVGFNSTNDISVNLNLCPRGTWNERMLLETMVLVVTNVCGLKKAFHRFYRYFETRSAYIAAIWISAASESIA